MTPPVSERADPRFALEDLAELAGSVLLALGARTADADTFARGLVVADARGVESHGVARLPAYVRKIEEGLVDLVAVPSIVSRDGSAVSVDGNHTLGRWPPSSR
jgi:LDH2 family malate/lactate/ureidoglycolate dehydrogenase